MDAIVFTIMDIIGTIAFSISGTIVGIHRRLDIFGIVVTSLATAIGGGVIRDLILGINPPTAFENPRNAMIAIVIAVIGFAFNSRGQLEDHAYFIKLNGLYILSDAMGLGLFVVVGMNAGIRMGHVGNPFLLIFVGVCTGVGGGIIRDTLCGRVPSVLNGGDLYASAGIIGGVYYYMMRGTEAPHTLSMILSVVLITMVRLASLAMNLNLPNAKFRTRDKREQNPFGDAK